MYCKIFSSIYQGSLRGRSDALLVFVNLLCNADKEGYVDRHFRAIADETGIPEDRVRAACAELEAVDTESRTPDEEGRRIVRIDSHRTWGWRVVNYMKYRGTRNAEDRRETWRESKRRCRERAAQEREQAENVHQCPPMSTTVRAIPHIAEAEAEAEALNPPSSENPPSPPPSGGSPSGLAEKIYAAYPRKAGRKKAIAAIQAALRSKRVDPAYLLERTEEYARIAGSAPPDRVRFIPHPATWFNQGRWDDDPGEWALMFASAKPQRDPNWAARNASL